MKEMNMTSLLETTMGPIEVRTTTISWWLTTLTFGFFRKVVCQVRGRAFHRYEELCQQWTEMAGSTPVERHAIKSMDIFRTPYFRVKLWHKHTKEYAKALGGTMSDHYSAMQLLCRIKKAIESDDHELAHKLLEELKRRDQEQAKMWKDFRDQ